MQRTRWVDQRKFSFSFYLALVTQLIDIRKSIKLKTWLKTLIIAAGRQMVISCDASSCVHKHLCFGCSVCRRARQECLHLRVSGVSLCLQPQLLASYRLYVSHNTLRSSRRSGSPRSPSQPVRPRRLCPRSNWSESHATREPRWRSSLPPRHQQESERAGETSCQPSLENHILNKWGMSHLPTWRYFARF